MLTASSEPCIGTDGQVASDPRENHAFCAGRADLLSDWSVNPPLHPMLGQKTFAESCISPQGSAQSGFSWSSSGKSRLNFYKSFTEENSL
jgi:hypothetical protein